MDVKQKVFAENIKILENYINAKQPSKDDIQLKIMLNNVLTIMFYEEQEKLKKTLKARWNIFLTWLLLEKPLPPDVLLGYLKIIQNIIRKNYKRYSTTIDYYFDPSVFLKSFTHAGLLQKRQKNIFLKQLIEDMNRLKQEKRTQEQLLNPLKKRIITTTSMPIQQKTLNEMKKQLYKFRDAILEGRELLIEEELEKTLEMLFLFQQHKQWESIKKQWYTTLVWILRSHLSKEIKISIMKRIQNKIRALSRTSKKPFVEKIFPSKNFAHSMQRGHHLKKHIFINQILDYLYENYKTKKLSVDDIFYGEKLDLFSPQSQQKQQQLISSKDQLPLTYDQLPLTSLQQSKQILPPKPNRPPPPLPPMSMLV